MEEAALSVCLRIYLRVHISGLTTLIWSFKSIHEYLSPDKRSSDRVAADEGLSSGMSIIRALGLDTVCCAGGISIYSFRQEFSLHHNPLVSWM
jgi:hypothetical protein